MVGKVGGVQRDCRDTAGLEELGSVQPVSTDYDNRTLIEMKAQHLFSALVVLLILA
jgi:hypothetical protein